MARLPSIEPADLEPEQKTVLAAINEGPRGTGVGMVGPFNAWVRAPSVGMAAQELGAAVRYRTSFCESAREVATHAELAVASGVDAENVEAIRKGTRPDFLARDENLAYFVAHQLMTTHRIEDALYADAKACFGEMGLIELVSIVGYYCLVSLTLNAFLEPAPKSKIDPFAAV